MPESSTWLSTVDELRELLGQGLNVSVLNHVGRVPQEGTEDEGVPRCLIHTVGSPRAAFRCVAAGVGRGVLSKSDDQLPRLPGNLLEDGFLNELNIHHCQGAAALAGT